MRTRIVFPTLFLLAALIVAPTLAQDTTPEPVGLRPDAPAYALHGPYWVGTQEFVVENLERPLPVTVWYPALNPDNREESVTYSVELRWFPKPDVPATVAGHALRDADPDASGAPYPLVVFSPGGAMYAAGYVNLLEHLASQGFVVIAPEHGEGFYFEGDPWQGLDVAHVERPRDIHRVIDYAERLTASAGVFEGFIDLDHVAVAGHSFGGYTTLAAAGARLDMKGFIERCKAARAAGDPGAWLCDPLDTYEDEIAAAAGLDSIPEGVWPSWGDSRVDAAISMAGDSYLFDQAGLAEITIPVLAMGGTADTGTPFAWGAQPTYEYASSQQKALVAFESGEHGLFAVKCDAEPWWVDIGFFGLCAEPIWDKDRTHDLVNHFTTAFLLDTLKGDPEAHAALLAENVSFPGITYETTMK